MNSDLKKLKDLVGKIQFAMLTTVEPDGRLFSRPMGAQTLDEDGMLWFFTGKSSGKVNAIQKDHEVNVAYSSPQDSLYISISGKADLVEDPEKIKELWSPMLKAWFPKGIQDPEVSLLKVKITSAEYWDSPSSKVVQLIGFAKAALTGEPYKPSREENERMDLSH